MIERNRHQSNKNQCARDRTRLIRAGLAWRLIALVFLAVTIGGCAGSDSQTEQGTKTLAAATATPVATAATPAPEPTPTATTTAIAEATAPPAPTPVPEPTVAPIELVAFDDDFATSIAPILATKCASCHNAEGPGAAHWRLETAADVVATHQLVTGVIDTGYMPPWPASNLSLIFHDNRSLRADEIQAIVDWSSAGAPLDVTADSPISSPTGTVGIGADIELSPHESFQGSTAVADDLRCLIYDMDLTEQAWVKSFEFVPDQTQIVHHAVAFLMPAEGRQAAQQLSDQDELGGWQCYGSPRFELRPELAFAWTPGQQPTTFPAGSGVRIDPGDFLVVQVHYHFDAAAPADSSTIRVAWADGADNDLDRIEFTQFLGPAEIPCSANESGPLCDRDVALANATDKYGAEGVLAEFINRLCAVGPEDFAHMTNGLASSSCEHLILEDREIISVLAHQHELGKSFRLTVNAGRDDERILLDIPDWSFDWQYNYSPVEAVVLKRGDRVLVECEWDRSRRAADLDPAYLLWADGTNDEMCTAFVTTLPANNS